MKYIFVTLALVALLVGAVLADPKTMLLTRGDRLVRQAKEVLLKHPHSVVKADIETTVAEVETLLREIQANPETEELVKKEKELKTKEGRLGMLILAAEHSH